ncbi:alkaline phosphatase PhoX [Blastomonas sp.]|uniref:alkaline phosphatase PhoX n=1 Tax=Blastomonas sp. TaxID=1909299 RepID=UPI0039190166
MDRREFGMGLTALAFAGLAGCAYAGRGSRTTDSSLLPDPEGLLDLPPGYAYRVISRAGDRMDDGHVVGDRADGMGCFALGNGRVALVRNHELQVKHHGTGPFGSRAVALAYDRSGDSRALPGGTSTLVYDLRSGRVEAQYQSLAGTIRNCAGGITPWGSWLTCEEDVTRAGNGVARDHGWVFEVPAAHKGLVDPVPLTAMGRFNHEAAAIDPATGIVYLTEDRDDSLFYRFRPAARGQLAAGGRLQALAFVEPGLDDTRNWSGITLARGATRPVRWIDLTGTESPEDDLRLRGHAAGAARFARGEGVHFGNGSIYFCCTSGGAAKLGQVMRYVPSRFEGNADERSSPGMLQNFVESDDPDLFNFGDNLTVAPNGHLVVCEDQYTLIKNNHLRGVTPTGELYTLARCRIQTELAGACFSPDGSTLFVNLYSPAMTLAVTGPWTRG